MSCSGIHCAGCAGGAAAPVIPFAAVFGLAWVAEHLVEVAVASVACATLAVAAIVMLVRYADRRDARPVQLWSARAVPATANPQVAATVISPAIEQHLHIHYHGAAPQEAPVIMRPAITEERA